MDRMERGQRSVERMHDVREQGKYKACVHMSMWHLRSLQQIDPRMGVPESTKVSNARGTHRIPRRHDRAAGGILPILRRGFASIAAIWPPLARKRPSHSEQAHLQPRPRILSNDLYYAARRTLAAGPKSVKTSCDVLSTKNSVIRRKMRLNKRCFGTQSPPRRRPRGPRAAARAPGHGHKLMRRPRQRTGTHRRCIAL